MLVKKVSLIILLILLIQLSTGSIVLAEDRYEILNIAMTMNGWVILVVVLLLTYVLVWPLFYLFWKPFRISPSLAIRIAIIGSIFLSLFFYHLYFYPNYVYIGADKIVWNTVPIHVIGIEIIIFAIIIMICFITNSQKSRRA